MGILICLGFVCKCREKMENGICQERNGVGRPFI